MKKSCRTCKYYHLNKDCMPCYVCTDGNQFELDNEFAQFEWISVEDRLPINDYEKHWKDRNYYLVYTQPCEIMFVATYGYKNNDWWCDMNDFVLDEKNWNVVTHYMPLPTPPKMKGAE